MRNRHSTEQKRISRTRIRYCNSKLPVEFDNFRILHISDLHNRLFGARQQLLMQHTKDISPDIIVVTGDLIDSRRPNIDVAMMYISQAVKLAPVYFVPGNHEKRLERYDEISVVLNEAGVNVLDDRAMLIKRDNASLALIGVKDSTFSSDVDFEKTVDILSGELVSDLKILLTHKPRMHIYSKYDIDLVFCGHAHGGQIRLPLVGGVYAPEQGLFPKYTNGIHTENDTSMVVSRGLGNSIFPIRIFNRPELVVLQMVRRNR